MATNTFYELLRKHGRKEVALAVGKIAGHRPIKSAAQMSKVVVLLLEEVNTLVEMGDIQHLTLCC